MYVYVCVCLCACMHACMRMKCIYVCVRVCSMHECVHSSESTSENIHLRHQECNFLDLSFSLSLCKYTISNTHGTSDACRHIPEARIHFHIPNQAQCSEYFSLLHITM